MISFLFSEVTPFKVAGGVVGDTPPHPFQLRKIR
jgi:hypothetical protein